LLTIVIFLISFLHVLYISLNKNLDKENIIIKNEKKKNKKYVRVKLGRRIVLGEQKKKINK